jgi:hypothetical protein
VALDRSAVTRTPHERKGNESVNKDIDRGDSSFVPTPVVAKPDAEVEGEIRKRIEEAFKAVCVELDEANRRGFVVRFDVGCDLYGRNSLIYLMIAKPF